MSVLRECLVGPFGPWRVRQRPAGDWVVDQLDRGTMRVRRYGPYADEAEARAVYEDLTEPEEAMA